jgi:hypothetical protein
MTYPASSDVSSGQPTASAHYNNLRKDALHLGQVSADSVNLGTFFSHYIENVSLAYLATNRVYCPYVADRPARIMINGYMLGQSAAVELPAGQFSGAASIWYIFANRSPASVTFSLSVSTSAIPGADQRLIGQCYWDGTNLLAVSVYSYSQTMIPPADYDSGWFAVIANTFYTKTHNFFSLPRHIMLLYNSAADGSGSTFVIYVVETAAGTKDLLQISTTQIIAKTGNGSTGAVLFNSNGYSTTGYYRILAWR